MARLITVSNTTRNISLHWPAVSPHKPLSLRNRTKRRSVDSAAKRYAPVLGFAQEQRIDSPLCLMNESARAMRYGDSEAGAHGGAAESTRVPTLSPNEERLRRPIQQAPNGLAAFTSAAGSSRLSPRSLPDNSWHMTRWVRMRTMSSESPRRCAHARFGRPWHRSAALGSVLRCRCWSPSGSRASDSRPGSPAPAPTGSRPAARARSGSPACSPQRYLRLPPPR